MFQRYELTRNLYFFIKDDFRTKFRDQEKYSLGSYVEFWYRVPITKFSINASWRNFTFRRPIKDKPALKISRILRLGVDTYSIHELKSIDLHHDRRSPIFIITCCLTLSIVIRASYKSGLIINDLICLNSFYRLLSVIF